MMFYLILQAIFPLGVMSNSFLNPTNVMWERNDKLLITMDFIYDNLAGPIQNELCNSHKRYFSIIAQSILGHLKKPEKNTKITKKNMKLLNHPADVIAANVRRDLNLLRAIVDQPINDIKKYCQANITSVDCEEKVMYNTALQTLKCPFYLNHVQLREDLENLLLAQDFQNLLEEAIKNSVNGTDKKALGFFVQTVFNKRTVLDKMALLYRKYKHGIFPCMYTGLLENWQYFMCPNINNDLE